MRHPARCARAAAWLATLVAGAASAAPLTYQGTITFGTTVNGTVGATGWLDETAADVDFWRMVVPAGGWVVTVRGARVQGDLDPAFSLFRGTTTADESAFRAEADWGGLVYFATGDDEIPNPGPGGDPLFTSPLAAGDYTIAIGGFLSTGAGPYAYTLAVGAIPEPATTTLAVLGAAAVAAAVRRRRRGEPPPAELQT